MVSKDKNGRKDQLAMMMSEDEGLAAETGQYLS
jgi:hypothetical protein